LQCTAQAARNVPANTTTVWPAFLLAGMKVNGYNAQQEVAVNCAGFQTQLAHAIVIAMQAQSRCCFSALHHRYNALLLAYQQHVATV
jgi:hypothetical protein